jgi:hypothetical protein
MLAIFNALAVSTWAEEGLFRARLKVADSIAAIVLRIASNGNWEK